MSNAHTKCQKLRLVVGEAVVEVPRGLGCDVKYD